MFDLYYTFQVGFYDKRFIVYLEIWETSFQDERVSCFSDTDAFIMLFSGTEWFLKGCFM